MEHFHIREGRFVENCSRNGGSLTEEVRKAKEISQFLDGSLPAWYSQLIPSFHVSGNLCIRLISQLEGFRS